ncbi:asparagine synthase-domain-containing protein [Phlebopus sp. FC_14]|nr:asparagine synthase-domain-containing protein [Phlebopus sp. FC_14]
MCGILCSVRARCPCTPHIDDEVFERLSVDLRNANAARGPDAQRSLKRRLQSFCSKCSTAEHERCQVAVEFFASELRLRGNAPVVQPHQQEGDVLCWNGEVFEGLDMDPCENDGVKIFERFRSLSTPGWSIPILLGAVEGPYAFVYYNSSLEKIYFARDPLGRRSLLIHKPTSTRPYFLLVSVSVGDSPAYELEELSTEGIFCLDIGGLSRSDDLLTGFHNCLTIIKRHGAVQGENFPFAEPNKVNATLPPDDLHRIQALDGAIPAPLSQAVDDLISHLDKSIMLRVRDIPPVKRGQGKARIAVLFSGGIDSTILAFLAHRHIPINEPIDLLNVAFENPRKIQVQLDGNTGALAKRTKKRQIMGAAAASGALHYEVRYAVPDRLTGLQEVQELRRTCPGRMWNFVEVDVSYEESQAARSTIQAIMFPSRTVMDLSLAMALYFASRGVGRICESPTSSYHSYRSPARVLLNGLGSDELLGGYGRHRTAFAERGWQGVIDELQLELDRIPTRNLGRDDRIISSHGKETRHPFLSLSVVSFLAGLPIHLKLDPRLDVGIGDKTLLRLAARKVGLVEASARKKRAMQFGSHSARMEVGEDERRGDLRIKSTSGS